MFSVPLKAMNRENQPPVTAEPVEFREINDQSSRLEEKYTKHDI